jgi:predicted transcriptional regulator
MPDNAIAEDTLLTLTADIVAAHVSNNSVAVNDLPNLIQNVHSALTGISPSRSAPEAKPEPKVPVRSSVKPDFIVCLEDGKKLKMLKRHLMTHYNMTPDEYRQKWGLSADYPMVAPNYAEQRRALAKSIGLGTKRRKTRGGGKAK